MPGARASFEVLVTAGAEQDLESIHDCVSECHGVAADERRDMLSLLARRLLGA
jgi:hypothetical protein